MEAERKAVEAAQAAKKRAEDAAAKLKEQQDKRVKEMQQNKVDADNLAKDKQKLIAKLEAVRGLDCFLSNSVGNRHLYAVCRNISASWTTNAGRLPGATSSMCSKCSTSSVILTALRRYMYCLTVIRDMLMIIFRP